MRIELSRGKFVRMTRGAGSTVTAHAGSVWITEENDLALVDAFADAELSLEHSDRASIACADSV